MNQDLQTTNTTNTTTDTQDSTLTNGGFNTTTSYATGSVCQFSGTYVAKNKYMDLFGLYAAGEIFRVGPDGRKTTWTALTPTLSTNSDGSFTSVKVEPGTI